MEHKVNAQAGEEAKVKLYGDTYTVTLDDNAKAELVLYGQVHTITGEKEVKAKKVKKDDTKAK